MGINSLDQIATPEDRVCVLNILGGESRTVTSISHAFSGGNVVFGTSPGRSGQVLKTPAGDIPVFNTVLEGLKAGAQVQHGRRLSAALGRARRGSRVDPGEPRTAQDRHHHRKDRRA